MSLKITSFEQACELRKISTDLPIVSSLPERFQKSIIAHYKLEVIAEAQNEGHVFNLSDYNEYKYYPWFDLETYESDSTGVGFRFGVCVCGLSGSTVGSRLCFRTREDAKHIGKTFLELYKDMMIQ